MNSANLDSEVLVGKWIFRYIDSGTGERGYPGFQLLHVFPDLTAHLYRKFTLSEKWQTLKISNDVMHTTNDVKFAEYQLLNEDQIVFLIEGKANDRDAIFKLHFVRLKPTITELGKEELEGLSFYFVENERETVFSFKKEDVDEKKHISSGDNPKTRYMIEKIDDTFFVSIFSNQKREASFQIKEVNNELMVLDVPILPEDVVAKRKH